METDYYIKYWGGESEYSLVVKHAETFNEDDPENWVLIYNTNMVDISDNVEAMMHGKLWLDKKKGVFVAI